LGFLTGEILGPLSIFENWSPLIKSKCWALSSVFKVVEKQIKLD
jgi:hypothetical protein